MMTQSLHPHSDEAGFTLMEVLLVLVILGILGVIAIPKYFDLGSRIDMKAAEAAVAEAQTRINTRLGKAVSSGLACKDALDRVRLISLIADSHSGSDYVFGQFVLSGNDSITHEGTAVSVRSIGTPAEKAVSAASLKLILPACPDAKDHWKGDSGSALDGAGSGSDSVSEGDRNPVGDSVSTDTSGTDDESGDTSGSSENPAPTGDYAVKKSTCRSMLNHISTANQLCQYWPRVLSGNAVFSDPRCLVFIGSQGHYGLGIVLKDRSEPLPLQIDIIYTSVPQGGFTQGTIYKSPRNLWVWTGEEPTTSLPGSISGWVTIKKGEPYGQSKN